MDKKELEIIKDPRFAVMIKIAAEQGAKTALAKVGLQDEVLKHILLHQQFQLWQLRQQPFLHNLKSYH